MKNKMILSLLASSVVIGSLAFASASLAADGNTGKWGGGRIGNMKPAIVGTVSAISGNTLTVSGRLGPGVTTTATTFTVDATNAKVMKNNVVGTVSVIAVGDTVLVQGTVTGTNVVATTIRDGSMMGGRGRMMDRDDNEKGDAKKPGQTPNPMIAGNGQPIVAGTVSAISGSTITITNKSNVAYTIDASNAKIVQGKNTITISGITVGDTIVAQGTVNGTAVTASSVIDQSNIVATKHMNLFGGIGRFFMHMFGF